MQKMLKESTINLAIGIVLGLLGAGILFLISHKPYGDPISLLPPPTPEPILVHIVGAVNQPGVYELDQKSRVQDIIREAGGLCTNADTQKLNLAAILKDGQQIIVPTLFSAWESHNEPQILSPDSTPSNVTIKININQATLENLDSLPYINLEYAQRIIAYREENGPFTNIEEIQEVFGIGLYTYERIKDLITVDDIP
jgi:competence protein ComEA